jgi:hypothetical protein
MKFKLLLIAIAVCVFAAWVNVNVVWADEQPTRTLYNNKVPYKALFVNHQPNQINVQAQTKQGKVQAVIPVVNDKEKDLTQQTKGN